MVTERSFELMSEKSFGIQVETVTAGTTAITLRNLAWLIHLGFNLLNNITLKTRTDFTLCMCETEFRTLTTRKQGPQNIVLGLHKGTSE
jgi:hypothetical protein